MEWWNGIALSSPSFTSAMCCCVSTICCCYYWALFTVGLHYRQQGLAQRGKRYTARCSNRSTGMDGYTYNFLFNNTLLYVNRSKCWQHPCTLGMWHCTSFSSRLTSHSTRSVATNRTCERTGVAQRLSEWKQSSEPLSGCEKLSITCV